MALQMLTIEILSVLVIVTIAIILQLVCDDNTIFTFIQDL